MKKKVLIIIGLMTAALIVLAVLKPFKAKTAEYSFETVKVAKGDITNTVTSTGTLEAITTVEIGTQVSGIIEHVYVDFNDNVKQGQVLARLDETPLRAQVEQSQASVDQARAQLDFQEATYNRMKALYEKNLIAQADYDQAVYNYQNSKASLNNAKSAFDRANVNLAYATIYSPIDGVVLNRAIEEGQTVAASFNTPEMFTIANDLTRMEVQASIDEADIGQVKLGQRVQFTVDSYPDEKFEGSVSQVRLKPVTTNNVVTYVVIFSAPNPEKKLMPGMTASATIFIEEKLNTLVLSGKAVRFTPDSEYMNMPVPSAAMPGGSMPEGMPLPGSFPELPEGVRTVWVKNTDNSLKPVMIRLGIQNGSNVEVLSGLNEGDEVIVAMTDPLEKSSTRRDGGPRGPMPF
ncbi:MAG: efflux RND transporter periplasmic adaptor subunit [Bacteroidales bacterium]|jgi:HlyD family secretion protein|nr:efflux RND transporter periplasmic adaptor subunit [Bacteroidales bacterium]